MRWPLAIPVVLPLVLAGYFIALYRLAAPGLHPVIWSTVLALTLAIWPAVSGYFKSKAEARVETAIAQHEWETKEKSRVREANLVKLDALSTDKHISQWLTLMSKDSGVRDEAIAKFRTAERRQGDMEEALGYGIPAFMWLVPELDLQPTPKLCEAGKAYLVKEAKAYRLKDREPYPYEASESLDGAVPAIHWFEAHGCNCDEGITALRAVVMTYLASPAREKLLADLSARP
jgi:hypothetical protein